MLLSKLLFEANIENRNYDDFEINDIVFDSRKAGINVAFVCLRGFNSDGHDFAKDAYDSGVRVFFSERKLALDDAIVIICEDTSVALAKLSDAFFGHPSERMKLIGVTGTKGKTTTTSLIYSVLNKNGIRAGLIGTVGIFYDGEHVCIPNTTPDSYTVNKYLCEMADRGISYAVMEVSSQAYLGNRVYGLHFDIGVYTNISADHIGPGESDSFEHYLSLKQMLLKNSDIALINADDAHASEFSGLANIRDVILSCTENADYTGGNLRLWKQDNRFGISFELRSGSEKFAVKSLLPGKYNMYNLISAFAVCDLIGVERKRIVSVLCESVVPGRFEVVDTFDKCPIIIDYAHNEVSLENVLQTVREYQPDRLVVLFGCVGGKSRLRRAAMAHVANDLADFAVISSDNPDFEDPDAIISDIVSEIDTGKCGYIAIADRREAIKWALENARSGDILLLAGKGHEDYQLIKGKKVPFDEREIICETVRSLQTV